MTKTTGTWILLVALIAAPMLTWWSTQEAPALATVAATTVPPARTSTPAQVRVQPASTLDREAIAQDLRAIDRIARARKQRGKDDPVVNDLIYITSVSCAQYEAVAGKYRCLRASCRPWRRCGTILCAPGLTTISNKRAQALIRKSS